MQRSTVVRPQAAYANPNHFAFAQMGAPMMMPQGYGQLAGMAYPQMMPGAATQILQGRPLQMAGMPS
eukprot:1684086-Prymnesium_polylepis.1